jgi:hypothetical protein
MITITQNGKTQGSLKDDKDIGPQRARAKHEKRAGEEIETRRKSQESRSHESKAGRNGEDAGSLHSSNRIQRAQSRGMKRQWMKTGSSSRPMERGMNGGPWSSRPMG